MRVSAEDPDWSVRHVPNSRQTPTFNTRQLNNHTRRGLEVAQIRTQRQSMTKKGFLLSAVKQV
jgi:hypothetical protein